MNKKTIGLICIFIVLLFLNSCGSTDNWKMIEIEGYGSIKVPEVWEFSIVDEFIYLSTEESGGSKNILVQYRANHNTNKHLAEIEESIWLQDENFSNGACVTKSEVHYQDGSSAEMFILYFTGPNIDESTEFFCLDNSISEDTLKKIAKSYRTATA